MWGLTQRIKELEDEVARLRRLVEVLPKRYWAAVIVASNWRIRQRLPRLTALAISIGLDMEVR